MWTPTGAVLIDPAAHAGHRETDLAMLALFGCPHYDAILAGYQRVRSLKPGWRNRIGYTSSSRYWRMWSCSAAGMHDRRMPPPAPRWPPDVPGHIAKSVVGGLGNRCGLGRVARPTR
ncbi:fructosamine kinase family protein [Mycobacterium kansasii]|uniref:Fructosamine kinase family protein n=1 Tax=Mycobacterium kansasii TaxID=1768 RepID=A0A1V3XG08_MYCKA|nr:fructosamine kinase family protein [Mycobacterium kansasii]